jgi:hypothetical protein
MNQVRAFVPPPARLKTTAKTLITVRHLLSYINRRKNLTQYRRKLDHVFIKFDAVRLERFSL